MSLRRLVWFMAGDPPPLGEDDLSKAMERHRGALLRGERAALARMRKAYRTARKRILREAAALFRVMARAQAAGLPLGESWLPRQERYSILLETVRAQMDRFGAAASKIGTGLMATWGASGAANAADLMEIEVAIADAQGAIPRGFTKAITRLPKEAVEAVVGALSEGSPLQDLLGGYGRASAAKASETLTAGVAQGHNPRKIARALRASLDGDAQRAERIARTEGIRAQRTAAILNYQANSDVVAGWRWSSSRDRRTCPVCLALDGQEFALDEPMGAHPSCRCVPVPINRFRPSTRGTGEEWLRAQPDAVARQMLGPSRYRLWKDGTPLPTFVRRGNDPRWGPWARLIPLRELGGGLPPLPVLPAPSPPAPPKLLGGAASASLEFSPKLTRKMRETLQEVADGIDGLHGVGQMASVKVVRVLTVGRRKVAVPGAGKVPVVPSSGKATLGAFRYVPNQGAVDISVSTHGDHPRMTFAHEFAHLLDHVHGLSKSRKLAEGFVRSGARERLVKERAAGRGTAAYLAYLLQPREVWARAYSQWAAVRLGGEIAEELAKDVASSGTVQWLDGEFDEMARAVEEVLKEAGLL